MIGFGPVGPLPPTKPAAEPQTATAQTTPVAASPSGTVGDAAPASRAETTQAVDPARQTAASIGVPVEERADEARPIPGLVEPSRAAVELMTPEMTERTPAGPPPTFDVSILEKTLAVAKAGPDQPTPESSKAAPGPAETPLGRDEPPQQTEAAPAPNPETTEAQPRSEVEATAQADIKRPGTPARAEVPGETR